MYHTSVLWATASDLPAGWPILGHSHPFYHLFYIVSGTGVFLLNNQSYNVSPGTCLIIPPGVYHEVSDNDHTLLDIYEIKFALHNKELDDILSRQGPIIENASAFIEKSIQYIVYNWARRDALSLQYTDAFLCSLIMSFHLDQSLSTEQSSHYIDASRYSRMTKKIIAYVENNYSEQFTLEKLSETLGRKKQSLCTSFKKNTGITIIDYLNHIRIREATFRIYYGGMPVSVVGQHVGYTTYVHFARTFKKLVGISPRQYRGLYSLNHAEASEGNQANPHTALYEELFGSRILPLQDSIDSLRQLGEFALSTGLADSE